MTSPTAQRVINENEKLRAVRDASGSVMAIYNNNTFIEAPIYGASRLGVYYKQSNSSVYQLTDHLGNVRAVIAKAANNTPDITGATDYYPGGMPMPGHQIVGGIKYRYGYQGEFAETDEETGKPAFQLRLYDPRINRWLSPDPYGQFHSPYLAMGNDWVNGIDPDGGFEWKWWADTVNFLIGGDGVEFSEHHDEYYVKKFSMLNDGAVVLSRWNSVVDPDGGCDDGKGNMIPCPEDGSGTPPLRKEW